MKRRESIKLLLSLPVAIVIGRSATGQEPSARARILNPKESLKKLILYVGPWPDADKRIAENFADRFLKANYSNNLDPPESRAALQSLASRFPSRSVVSKEIDLRNLPSREQELLLNLVTQLYSLIEVLFYTCKQTPYGECQADPMRYTRAPVG